MGENSNYIKDEELERERERGRERERIRIEKGREGDKKRERR